MKEHISYSEFKDYVFCPYYHKLKWVDMCVPFEENEFLVFGKSLHKIAEIQVDNNPQNLDWAEEFDKVFLKNLQDWKSSKTLNVEFDKELLREMRMQGRMLSPQILSGLKNYFGEFEVLGKEEQLLENIQDSKFILPCKFKGFIDLVLKTKKDDKIHIIDHKSCSWGWKPEKKNDKLINYQLTFYKIFYAQKYGIDLKNIETHFCLLKRTAKKDNVECFRVTSGNKKISNAMSMLIDTIVKIQESKCWKNRSKCSECYLKDSMICKSL